MPRFLVVIEKADQNFSAYCPDIPGCVAAGESYEEAEASMREALKLHIEGLLEDDLPVPASAAHAEYMAV